MNVVPFLRSAVCAMLGLALVTMAILAIAGPLLADCNTLMCDESLFFHINGDQLYTLVHAPGSKGVYS